MTWNYFLAAALAQLRASVSLPGITHSFQGHENDEMKLDLQRASNYPQHIQQLNICCCHPPDGHLKERASEMVIDGSDSVPGGQGIRPSSNLSNY